jgi:hypothetical protein
MKITFYTTTLYKYFITFIITIDVFYYYDTDGSLYYMEYEQDQDILPEYPKKNAAFPSSNRLTLVINYIKRGGIQEKNMAA